MTLNGNITKIVFPNLFRHFLVQKEIRFFFADFDVFGQILSLFSPSRPPPNKKMVPTGPPFSFYIGNREKIGFPMSAAENGFQILNLHPKIHKKKK